jgi:hypothetical protein
MEGQIRKQRQEQVYKQDKLKQMITDGIAMFILVSLVFGAIGIASWMWMNK